MANRRSFLQSAFGLGAGLFAPAKLLAAATKPALPPAFNVPVVTTDVGDLPFILDSGVKVFHLTAEVLKQNIAPGKSLDLWGFNGSSPGPTIQVNEGDRVRVIVDNHLPEATTMHWHGFEDLIQFDGQPGISQQAIPPGGRFVYEFDIHQQGTYFYHSHMGMQQMAGMLGAFIMHPRAPHQPHCDKDFLLHLQEYAVLPSNTIPNTMNMEYNWLLLNGKAGPATTPLIVRQGDRVRIRFVNLGMDHHPMHMHGHSFHTTGTEAGRIQPSAWWPGNTVLVGVAQARDIEFDATNPGDWMIHCHLPHHMMNEMSSTVGTMTRQAGMASGVDMNTGMGMLNSTPGAPLGDDYGPSLGRGMGFGSSSDMASTNGPLSQPKAAQAAMGGMPMSMPDTQPIVSADASNVPNFPQDAYMEGPMMSMDQMVERPENYGLRPGWSQYMQGMMTFVRVLPPDKYDEVIARIKAANRPSDPYASVLRAQPASGAAKPAKQMPAPADAMPGMKRNMPGMGKMSMLLLIAMFLPALLPPHARAQQSMPGMTMPMPPPEAARPQPATNITHNTQALQEPEDPTHTTGENLPAPDLLEGVAARPALTLTSFLDPARKSSPTLAQARDLAHRSEAEARQAALYPNPTIGYQGEQIRGGSYAGGEQGAYIGQTIVLGGKLGLRRNVFDLERQADTTLLDEQTYGLTVDITQAFYTALTAQARVVLRRRLLALAADAVQTVHQLANVGQADAPDILQTEVESEQAKIDYVTAQRDFIAAFRTLAARSGQPNLPLTPLAGELESPPQFDPDQQLATILQSSPTLKRMQQQVAVAEARLKAAQHESIPDLDLKAGEEYNNERLGSPAPGLPARATGPQSFASAGITLPLWNRNQGNIEAARAELDRARQQVLEAELTLKATAAPLAQSYLAARFAADRYKTQLIPRAQRAYALYLAKYQNMSEAYPQVLVSQRTLFELQLKYLATLQDAWTNAVALQNFTLKGNPLTLPSFRKGGISNAAKRHRFA